MKFNSQTFRPGDIVSVDGKETFVVRSGPYQHGQNPAWLLDNANKLCDENRMKLLFRAPEEVETIHLNWQENTLGRNLTVVRTEKGHVTVACEPKKGDSHAWNVQAAWCSNGLPRTARYETRAESLLPAIARAECLRSVVDTLRLENAPEALVNAFAKAVGLRHKPETESEVS